MMASASFWKKRLQAHPVATFPRDNNLNGFEIAG